MMYAVYAEPGHLLMGKFPKEETARTLRERLASGVLPSSVPVGATFHVEEYHAMRCLCMRCGGE